MSSWLERYQRKRKRQRENQLFMLGFGVVVAVVAWVAIAPSLGISWDFFSVPKTAVVPPGIDLVTKDGQLPVSPPRVSNPQFERIKDVYWRMLAESLDPEEVAIARARVDRLEKVLMQKRPRPSPRPVATPPSPSPTPPELPPAAAEISPQPVAPQEIEVALKPATPPMVPPAPTPAPTPAPLDFGSLPGVNWFESSLPLLLRQLEDQLAGRLAIDRKSSATLKYTDQEFQLNILPGLQQRFPQQLRDFSARFRDNAMTISGTMMFSQTAVPVVFRVGLTVVEDKPHPILQALKLGAIDVPAPFLAILERRTIEVIDREKHSLKIRWIQIGDGWIRVSAELV